MAARRDILLAALGHDLYEDTEIPRQDIVDGFGSEVDALIRWLTEGASVPEYVEQVAKSPEEARLIEYGDLADNYGGLVANGLLNADPAKWVEKVRHKMEPMFERLFGVPFQKYPRAGAWLAEQARMRRESFWAETRKIRPDLG